MMMRIIIIVILLLLTSCAAAAAASATATASSASSDNNSDHHHRYDGICTNSHEWKDHPVLCSVLQSLHDNPERTIRNLHLFAKEQQNMIVDLRSSHDEDYDEVEDHYDDEKEVVTTAAGGTIMTTSEDDDQQDQQDQQLLPVVVVHGMGDSCYNGGMQHITQIISKWLDDRYTICIPIGTSQADDTKNGYFLNWNDSVDIFAQSVKDDNRLTQGFHAIGFSQGNNIIRGYIAKYNSPSVNTFISVNGVNAGIGAVPYCRPTSMTRFFSFPNIMNNKDSTTSTTAPESELSKFSMCDLLMEQASKRAYTEFAQEHSFQANYWRDPRLSQQTNYQKYCQLAKYNNEGFINETLRENWSLTQRFVWIMANDDEMVWPKLGEWWGAPDPNDPFHTILSMNETDWYINDNFGLRHAQEHGKNYFESFPGDHLQFELDDLHHWIMTYFTAAAAAAPTRLEVEGVDEDAVITTMMAR